MPQPRVSLDQAERDALMVTDAPGNLACAYVDAVIGGPAGVNDGVDPARYTAVLRSQPQLAVPSRYSQESVHKTGHNLTATNTA